ncbi:protein kinase [Amycolatopsis sp. OK19-0408]|uniref:non-specific serine/threonine protein kinase n=1 Tax=Amycolatopsis iheyensis TaxID=2945988 RepID=A0A9X2NPZ0_9PSEU|nr:protein kinase [Amycolatopsis iheyensis]MCR6489825.1 protein kinase [Amycolatopsis iheyensis]
MTSVLTVPDEPALGAGPVATVYSGLFDDVPVALKVFPARFDRATLAEVERDTARLRDLPSVLPADGVEQRADGRHALRMELCPQTLARLIDGDRWLQAGDAIVLGHVVATALAGAHAAGVVHGRVQPANVLFRPTGEPVLADFGVALRRAFPRDIDGELGYLAPETLRDETLDERTDLYGLGALLHRALTGRIPLPGQLGEPVGERIMRLLRTPVPVIDDPDVPVVLSAVVGRLLAPNPDHRPPDAAWVAARFAELLPESAETGPVEASSWSAQPSRVPTLDAVRPARTKRLRPNLVLGGAAAVCVAAIAAAAFFTGGTDDSATTAPASSPVKAPEDAGLELAEAQDHGSQVVLSWTSALAGIDYAVIVAPEGEPNHAELAGRTHTTTVRVDPLKRYCFEVRATDGRAVYTSLSRSIRGAVCNR